MILIIMPKQDFVFTIRKLFCKKIINCHFFNIKKGCLMEVRQPINGR